MNGPAVDLMPVDHRINSRHWLAADLILLVVFGLSAVYQRVTFQQIFGDFDVELPLLTRWMLSVPMAAVLGVVFVLAVVLVAKEFLVRDALVRRIWNIITWVVLIVIVVFHVVALLLPLTELITKIA